MQVMRLSALEAAGSLEVDRVWIGAPRSKLLRRRGRQGTDYLSVKFDGK